MERRYNIEDARYSLDDMNYYRNKIGCRLGRVLMWYYLVTVWLQINAQTFLLKAKDHQLIAASHTVTIRACPKWLASILFFKLSNS